MQDLVIEGIVTGIIIGMCCVAGCLASYSRIRRLQQRIDIIDLNRPVLVSIHDS